MLDTAPTAKFLAKNWYLFLYCLVSLGTPMQCLREKFLSYSNKKILGMYKILKERGKSYLRIPKK